MSILFCDRLQFQPMGSSWEERTYLAGSNEKGPSISDKSWMWTPGDSLHQASLPRTDTGILAINTQWDFGNPSPCSVTRGQRFLLKISTVLLCHQRDRVHFQSLHIDEVIFSSSLNAQIFRDNDMNEVSKIKCKIYRLVVIWTEWFVFQEGSFIIKMLLYFFSSNQFWPQHVNKIVNFRWNQVGSFYSGVMDSTVQQLS